MRYYYKFHKWGLGFEGIPGNEAAGFLSSIKNIVMPAIKLLVIDVNLW